MSTTTQKIEIALSDRAPVKIDPDKWPVIAFAETWNGEHKFQANYVRWIKVREHADGRRLVYGMLDSGNGGVPNGWRGASGGYLIDADQEAGTVRAIRRVAGLIEDPKLGDECLAALPAQEIGGSSEVETGRCESRPVHASCAC